MFVCNNKLIGGAAVPRHLQRRPGRRASCTQTARDCDGHGTHTASTAAGDVVDLGARCSASSAARSHGVAPGRLGLGLQGLRHRGLLQLRLRRRRRSRRSSTASKVINFSISGGTDPFTDPVELAFLDAYAAGVFVAASAGNAGPARARPTTSRRGSPRSPPRPSSGSSSSTLTLTGGDGTDATFTGASITAGVAGPRPSCSPRRRRTATTLCDAPAPPGTFTGKIVACQRGGNGRGREGLQRHGRAAPSGMILYNPTLADVETDNHWLPAVHLADGTAFLAFLAAHPGATATFTAGREGHRAQGDVMAAFSSRGPGGHVHQARRHRARRADPGRATPRRRTTSPAARPASTSRPSPAPRCRRRTSPARRSC